MADLKITDPRVVGKLKLPAESASKALIVDSSGQLTSSTVTDTELALLSGVSASLVTTTGTQTLTNKTLTAPAISSPTGLVKADVGLGNVDNTNDAGKPVSTAQQTALNLKADLASPTFTGTVSGISKAMVGLGNVDNTSNATERAAIATLTNKTIDAASNTISNIADANIASAAAIAQSKISGLVSDLSAKEATANKGVANGYASLDSGGKVPVSQLPNSIMEYQGTYDASTNTPTLIDGTGNTGDTYRVTVAGAGVNSLAFIVGDYAIYNGTTWEKVHSGADTIVSVNGQAGVVILTKSDVGLSAADNTSDATKNAASVTLTNKTIDTATNTISNLHVTNLASGVLDTDLTSVSASDDTIPSAKATKAYVDSLIGASGTTGDIAHTSFSAANNQSTAANVTGLAFAAGTVRGFRALVSVAINATTGLNETFDILGIKLASGYVISTSSVGDDSGVLFSITSAGQVQYTSQNSAGFVSNTIKFRAEVTQI